MQVAICDLVRFGCDFGQNLPAQNGPLHGVCYSRLDILVATRDQYWNVRMFLQGYSGQNPGDVPARQCFPIEQHIAQGRRDFGIRNAGDTPVEGKPK